MWMNIVDGYELDTDAFKRWKPELSAAEFVLEEENISADRRLKKCRSRNTIR